MAEFKFESKFEPLLPEAAKAISEGTEALKGFDSKINGTALGALL